MDPSGDGWTSGGTVGPGNVYSKITVEKSSPASVRTHTYGTTPCPRLYHPVKSSADPSGPGLWKPVPETKDHVTDP